MSKAKPKKGWRAKLTREQVLQFLQIAQTGVPTGPLARRFKLTLGEAQGCLKANNLGHFYLYEKPKDRVRLKKCEALEQRVQELYNQGYDDDQIAEQLKSTEPAIARIRSHYNITAFKKIILKGHCTKHQNKHSIDTQGTPLKVVQGELQFEAGERRVTVTSTPKETKVFTEKKPQATDTTGLIVMFNITGSKSDDLTEAQRQLVSRISWKSIAQRIQNPSWYYKLQVNNKLFYFKQVAADTGNGLITIELVTEVRNHLSEKK